MRNKRIMFTMVIAMVAIMTIFSFAGCKGKVDTSSDALNLNIYNVNGYQNAPTAEEITAMTKDPNVPVVPIETMLKETGLSLKNSKDTLEIAANIYHMAVRNAARIDRTGYQVATNASVHAVGIKAMGMKLDKVDVGLRSTYSSMDLGPATFSQTVSGVTQLDLVGLGNIGDILKSNFGYNIQDFHNEEFSAHRNGGNGDALFYNFEDEELQKLAPKLILGATIGKKPMKAFPSKPTPNRPWDQRDKKNSFVIQKNATANVSAQLAADASINTPWDDLKENPYGDPFYVPIPGKDPMKYQLGNMGCGWALYNFTKDNLDSETTKVEYDKKTGVYTLTMNVKKGMEDDACFFAKSNLVKDTRYYVVLDEPEYKELTNVIQVHESGLIKSWQRHELLTAEGRQAYLTVFTNGTPGNDIASGGGSTGNDSISVFSYDEVDCNPVRLAAIYWPELGDQTVMDKFKLGVTALDFKDYPNFENYVPLVNGEPYKMQ